MSSVESTGETYGRIGYNLPEWMAIAGFTAVAWYNILQLNVSIFLTFKRRRGLYFWSLLISGYGVIFHSVGFLLKLFALTDNEWLPVTLITIGWWPMVTGQALVLYSRLHLVVKEEKVLKAVLAMIIWNAVTLHPPTTILTYGSSSDDWRNFLPGFNVMERIQMTIFCLQEIVLSCIYLWAAFRLLKPVYRRRIRMVMLQLLWVNFIMAAMDISMLTMEYLGNYAIEATLKSMIYAVKLTLEFAVLNQLMRLANSGRTTHDMETIAEKTEDLDDEEAQERPRKANRFVPQRMAKLHIAPRSASISSPSNEQPRRISSIARQPSLCDTPSTASALFTTRSKDSGLRSGIPKLTIDPEQHSNASSPSTIINNPAAFVPSRPKLRDPFAIEDSTPAITPYEPASPPQAVFKDYPQSYFDTPKKPSAVAAICQQSKELKNRVLTPAPEEEERNATPDPELLLTRRPSVMDLVQEDSSSGEIEADLGADAASPGLVDSASLKRLSGRGGGEASHPAWFSPYQRGASRSPSPNGERRAAGDETRPNDSHGATDLEFVTSAL